MCFSMCDGKGAVSQNNYDHNTTEQVSIRHR
jgi:hypothetical protein